jgi:hypothetical protein
LFYYEDTDPDFNFLVLSSRFNSIIELLGLQIKSRHQKQLLVVPNPFDDYFEIVFTDLVDSIELFDLLGQSVLYKRTS